MIPHFSPNLYIYINWEKNVGSLGLLIFKNYPYAIIFQFLKYYFHILCHFYHFNISSVALYLHTQFNK